MAKSMVSCTLSQPIDLIFGGIIAVQAWDGPWDTATESRDGGSEMLSGNMVCWKILYQYGGFQLGKSLINGPFSMAMFDYRRVITENRY